MLDSILELFRTLFNAEKLRVLLETTLSGWHAYVVLAAIVFAETGLLVGFLLPGDSLLFIVGVICGAGHLNIVWINILLIAAAIIGDGVGYYLGRRAGPAIFNRPSSRLFRREHLMRTHEFYEKYGGKTIIIARFVPIVRTFAPIVAGAGQMPYRKFVAFNVVGGLLWVFSMVLAGYYLGTLLRDKLGINLDEHIEWVIIIVILLSLTPAIYEYVKSRLEKRRSAIREQAAVAAVENDRI